MACIRLAASNKSLTQYLFIASGLSSDDKNDRWKNVKNKAKNEKKQILQS